MFSVDSGFYHQDSLEISLTSPDTDISIYYTLDGSEPTENAIEYTAPAVLYPAYDNPNVFSTIPTTIPHGGWGWVEPSGVVPKINVVRAIAIAEDGSKSDITSKTFIIGTDIQNLHDFPIVSVLTDSVHFFSHETGIYVPGENYDNHIYTGNYHERGRAWERPGYLGFFEHDSNFHFEQNVGFRIHGGATRRYPQKGLRIYARSEYDDNSRINQRLFPDNKRLIDGRQLEEYKRLILRPSGDDWFHTMFKDAMVQGLYDGIKLDMQAYRPTVVYLNGEYWGIHNLRERYDGWYVQTNYDIHRDDVVILQDGGRLGHGNVDDVQEYIAFLDEIDSRDISLNENYEWIKTKIDVDNYLDYILLQIYSGNSDWPHNNIRYWRKRTNSYDPNADYGHDGRWRWMVFDMDASFGFPYSAGWAAYDHDMFDWISGQGNVRNGADWVNMIFNNLSDNEDFQEEFISRFTTYMNTRFHKKRVIHRIDSLKQIYKPEMELHIKRHPRSVGGSIQSWETQIEVLTEFAEKRAAYNFSHLANYFDLDKPTEINLTYPPHNARVKINETEIDDYIRNSDTGGVINWRGRFIPGEPVTITAKMVHGDSFNYWIQDEDTLRNKSITVYPEDVEQLTLFTDQVDTHIPSPELTYPANGDETPSTFTLRWNMNHSSNLEIKIDTTAHFRAPITYEISGQDSLRIQELEIGKTYYWKARYMLDENFSPWSDVLTFKVITTTDTPVETPPEFKVYANYPNPFNHNTVIPFYLPENEIVRIEILTVTGQKVALLRDERMNAGNHKISFDAEGLSSGIYIYNIRAGYHQETRKMLLIK